MLLVGGPLVLPSSLALGLTSFVSVCPSELTSIGRLFTRIIGATKSDLAFPISEPIWPVSAVQKKKPTMS